MGMRKTFIFLGFGAMSFAAEILVPPSTQSGGIFVAIGLLFFIVAFVSWLIKDKPSKQDLSRVDAVAPDMNMPSAIDYVVNVLFPDKSPNIGNIDTEERPTAEAITKKIKSGDLNTWGKRVEIKQEYGARRLTVNVDQEKFSTEDWKHRELLPLEASIPAGKTPQTRSIGRDDDHIQLTGLYVNEDQIKGVRWRNEDKVEQPEYMSLAEAARMLYEDLREFDKKHCQIIMAEGFRDKPGGVLNYFAITISAHAEVYGKRPPSTKLEKIDQDILNTGSFDNDGNEFVQFGKKEPEFVGMAVKSNDLPRVLDWLKSQNRFG